MKTQLLTLMLLCTTLSLHAQNRDPQFLSGAVPLVDGKVVFSRTYSTAGQTAQALFAEAKTWADERFKPDDPLRARVVYQDAKTSVLVALGEEYITFTSHALSLDRSRIQYRLTVRCTDQEVTATMSHIKYWYNEARDGGEHYIAEEWITDHAALNKKKTKLLPITGKFRRETIRLKDQLFHSLEQALQVAPSDRTQPTLPEATQNEELKRIVVVAQEGERIELPLSAWGGYGEEEKGKVTYLLIDKQKALLQYFFDQAKRYTVELYRTDLALPSETIHCTMQSKRPMAGNEAQKLNERAETDASYTLITGYVLTD